VGGVVGVGWVVWFLLMGGFGGRWVGWGVFVFGKGRVGEVLVGFWWDGGGGGCRGPAHVLEGRFWPGRGFSQRKHFKRRGKSEEKVPMTPGGGGGGGGVGGVGCFFKTGNVLTQRWKNCNG